MKTLLTIAMTIALLVGISAAQSGSQRAMLVIDSYAQAWVPDKGPDAIEAGLPIMLVLPIRDRAQIRAAAGISSFVAVRDESEIDSGDRAIMFGSTNALRIEGDYGISQYFLIGANLGLPTGKTDLSETEREAIAPFIRPEYSSRQPRPGSGLDFGGQIAGAFPITRALSFGASAGLQGRGAYTARESGGEIDPGDEVLLSAAADLSIARAGLRGAIIFTKFGAETYEGEDQFQSGNKIEYKLATSVNLGGSSLSAMLRHIRRSANSIGADLEAESSNSNNPYTVARLAFEGALSKSFHLIPSLQYRRLAENESGTGAVTVFGGGLEGAFPSRLSEVRVYFQGFSGEYDDSGDKFVGFGGGLRLAFYL